MRRLTPLSFVLALLALPSDAAAQESPHLGIGLGLEQVGILVDDDVGLLSILTPQVYVPIVVSDGLMLEPGIGVFRTKNSESSESADFEATFTFIRVGVGLLFTIQQAERGRVYVGPRIGLMRMSSSSEFNGEAEDDSRVDLTAAAVLGGEFFLLPAFSIGGEVGLEYLRMGDEEDDGEADIESDTSLLSLGSEFRVRWYID